MPILTKQLIANLNIQIDEATYALLDKHIEQTLDQRVTTEIVDALTDEQLRELDTYKSADDKSLATWLDENVPELQEIIKDETAILLGELAESSEKL